MEMAAWGLFGLENLFSCAEFGVNGDSGVSDSLDEARERGGELNEPLFRPNPLEYAPGGE